MKHTLELQENLWVKQAEVTDVLDRGGPSLRRSDLHRGGLSGAGGSGLHRHLPGGRTIVGDVTRQSGPDGLAAALP